VVCVSEYVVKLIERKGEKGEVRRMEGGRGEVSDDGGGGCVWWCWWAERGEKRRGYSHVFFN